MTNISLRTYTREIEKLIDSSQADQAIAHCRHILKSYPKCVDAYRLLGKAYLESQRYGDAADIFQRVLSSIPDDFVSHVGMSLIREDEGNLDQAIWNMERAFEVQPANAAIQGELRRLYGRRDGMEPPKIRLTRGALARMYARGELFQQAVAEIRAALAEDPNRLDLITLLASVYSQAGQKAEAVEMCNGLLRKLPYSLEGNRVMSEMLQDTDRVQDLQVYKRRLVALNPYFAQLSPAAPTVDRVPDQSVTIERLQWSPGMTVEGPASQPEWAASLGVQLSGMTSEKDILPDWLLNLEESAGEKGKTSTPVKSDQAASAFDNESLMQFARESQKTEPKEDKNANASTKPLKPSPEEAIPEWMKEAGWQPSSGEAQEEEGIISFKGEDDFMPTTDDESGLAEANIPEWLQAMAPSDETEAGSAEETGDNLAWLDNLQAEGPAETEGESEAEEDWLADSKVEVPDWLKEIEEEKSADELTPTKPLTEKPDVEESETEERSEAVPIDEDKSDELPPVAEQAEPEGKESVPDWLMEGMSGPDAHAAGQKYTPQPQEELAAEIGEGIPEWLRDFSPEDEAAAGEEETSDQVPDWLQSLAPESEGEVEGMVSEETAIPEDTEIKDTQEAEAPSATENVPPVESEILAEQAPELRAEPETQTEAEPSSEEEISTAQGIPTEEEATAWDIEGADDAFAWLESLAVKQGAEEALLLDPEERKDKPPDWVQSDLERQEEAGGTEPTDESQETEMAEEAHAEEELQPEAESAEVPDWLQELGPQGSEETGAEEVEAELPDWINAQPAMQEPEPFQDEAQVEEEPQGEVEPTEIPDWLQELEPEGSEDEEVVPQSQEGEGELPEWLDQGVEMHELQSPAEEALIEEPSEEAKAVEIPDWLQALEPEGSEKEEVAAPSQEVEGETPEWLSQGAEIQEPEPPEEEPQEEGAKAVEIPDWLQALEPEGGEVSEVATQAQEVEDELPKWLGQEAEMQEPEPPEEEPQEEGAKATEIPDWLQALEPEGGEVSEVATQAQEVEDELPKWPGQETEMQEPEPPEEALIEEPPEELEPAEIPDWLQALEPQSSDETEEAQVEAPAESEAESWFSEGPPILGDTQPVKTNTGTLTPATVPEAQPEAEVPVEAETAEAPEEIEAAHTEQEAELAEEQEQWTAASLVAEVSRDVSEEGTAEPVSTADEWQAEEPEAVESEEVAETLSEMQESDDAFAWLESLAVQQGADEALLLNPEERSETPPEWVKAEVEEAVEEEIQAEVEEPAATEQPGVEEQELTEEQEATMEPASAEGTTYPEEPAVIEAEAEIEETEEMQPSEWSPESEVAAPEEEVLAWMEEEPPAGLEQPVSEVEGKEEIPELPDWLQEGTTESAEEEAWTPSALEGELEKLDLNQASLAELERLPDIGFRMAQNIVNYRDNYGAFQSVDDLLNIPGLGPDMLNDIREWLFIKPQPEEIPEAPPSLLEELEFGEAPPEVLEARQHLASGDLEQAAHSYTQLIKSNQHLDAIVQDLQTATQRYPQAIFLWQALGDAYLRAGQIQLALDAYNQAENLLS
jgi:competence ComEA-like helix-hairpin-helix protein